MKRKGFLGVLICLSLSACVAMPAMAGYSSSRSYSSFSKPRTVTVNKTYHRTTVVQQAAPSSSGGGFFSSFFGGAAGAGVTNYLMNKDEPAPQAAPPVQPVTPAAPACDAKLYDCTPKAAQ